MDGTIHELDVVLAVYNYSLDQKEESAIPLSRGISGG
jgi:hypothetical protein